jgi:hypothetical protein
MGSGLPDLMTARELVFPDECDGSCKAF